MQTLPQLFVTLVCAVLLLVTLTAARPIASIDTYDANTELQQGRQAHIIGPAVAEDDRLRSVFAVADHQRSLLDDEESEGEDAGEDAGDDGSADSAEGDEAGGDEGAGDDSGDQGGGEGEGDGGEADGGEGDGGEGDNGGEEGASDEAGDEGGDEKEEDDQGDGAEEPEVKKKETPAAAESTPKESGSTQKSFARSDHTDLYSVKRERDRAWDAAKKKGGIVPATKGKPKDAKDKGAKEKEGPTHSVRKANPAENGKWVEKNGEYLFVSVKGCVNETCPFTVSDENLKAALDLPSNANDAELLAGVMNPARWKRNSDSAYRDRVCRGSKHDMPRWCKGSAGPGGKYARELDEAEKAWIEQAGRRQESKQTLLVNHKAYLKEAKIQKESMQYTKKALEAQEAVDEATRLALQRVKMEAEVLKQVEQDEQDSWHDLVEIRQKVVKYRTMSKDQIAAMEKEEKEEEKQKEREARLRERNERAKERMQMEAQQKAKALMVERAKQKARQAQKELEKALAVAAKQVTTEGA
eukprot:CAMPEP_0197860612 /NCGR_PEP_ID=MMETSP1438-20131217/36092_1 /TAXON_ID=1461541 /ORGANISM="Pterosperma sp., Strain CCMP1384" /LENGTH=525 /DNA_ID=CAMNT_0043477541 /DNA_START=80 /DNA_END=1657 /DNA_ORIENTATION=-